MKKLKIYVLDSSVLVRQTVANIIRKTDETEVCGSASTKSSNDFIKEIKISGADGIVMGLDSKNSKEADLFLKLREVFPSIPFIMVTPRTTEGAKAAFFALQHGAVEYISKPPKSCNLVLALNHMEKRLAPALKMIPRLNVEAILKYNATSQIGSKIDPLRKHVNGRIELVVISGCTGGVQSLYNLIEGLAPDFPVPVIIVQHMPKIYTRVLANELDSKTSINVREATTDSLLLPGQVYIVPGGYHASIRNNGTRKQITLHRGPKEHKCRPSIDVLLRSARHVYTDRILAVFLSGGGKDGLLGAREIADAGGQIILQDQETSLLWDLPSKIYNQHLADGTFGLDEISAEITKRVHNMKPATGNVLQSQKRANKSNNNLDVLSL